MGGEKAKKERTGNLSLEGGGAAEEGAGLNLGGGADGHLGGGGGAGSDVADGSHCEVLCVEEGKKTAKEERCGGERGMMFCFLLVSEPLREKNNASRVPPSFATSSLLPARSHTSTRVAPESPSVCRAA